MSFVRNKKGEPLLEVVPEVPNEESFSVRNSLARPPEQSQLMDSQVRLGSDLIATWFDFRLNNQYFVQNVEID